MKILKNINSLKIKINSFLNNTYLLFKNIWQTLKKNFLDLISKQVFYWLIGLFALLATMIYRHINNPPITFKIKGSVVLIDSLFPISEALISVENKSTSIKTDKNGQFELEIKIRLKDEYIILNCSKEGYHSAEPKKISIPINQKKEFQSTKFHLKQIWSGSMVLN